MAHKSTGKARPFLKWAGGKGGLLSDILRRLPEGYGRYHEPFVGGGAVFFGLAPRAATLSDKNAELIHAYVTVRDDVDGLIEELGEHVYTSEHYYAVRALDPAGLPPRKRAARTVFLNRAGFNGLYRLNSRGQFNVPFGRYTNPRIVDAENLRACSRALIDVELRAEDFDAVLRRAQPGDLVYFDPPYVPLSSTASFTAYQAGGFGARDQEHLRDVFATLASRNVCCLLSNSDTPEVRALYKDFAIDEVQARRAINSKGSNRGPVGEVLVRSYA